MQSAGVFDLVWDCLFCGELPVYIVYWCQKMKYESTDNFKKNVSEEKILVQ